MVFFFQNVILKVLYHEIYQHLRGLHNSVNKYFPRDHNTILQNHAQVKKKKKKSPFTVQDKPMDFNVREYKVFTDMISGVTLQLAFKKQLCEFWYSIKESYPQLSEKLFK